MDDAQYEDRFPDLVRLAAHVAHRIVRDHDEAEDIAVETLARAFQRWSAIEAYAVPWVVRTATNLAIDRCRRAPRRVRVDPPAPQSTDGAVIANDTVDGMLRVLSGRQRQCVLLVVVCGYGADEAGVVLGISPSSVKTHVRRGIAMLRRSVILDPQEAASWIPTT